MTLRVSIHGGEPAVLVALAQVRSLDCTLPFHGNLLAILAGPHACITGGLAHLSVFTWEISSPPKWDLR